MITTSQTIENVLMPFIYIAQQAQQQQQQESSSSLSSSSGTITPIPAPIAPAVISANDITLVAAMNSGIRPSLSLTSSISPATMNEVQAGVLGILASLSAHDERLRESLCRDIPLAAIISCSTILICQAPLSLLLRTLASFPTLRWSLALRGCLSLALHMRSITLDKHVRNHCVALLYSLLLNDRVMSSCTSSQVNQLLPIMRAIAKDSRSSDTQARAASLTASLAAGNKAAAAAALIAARLNAPDIPNNGTSINGSMDASAANTSGIIDDQYY
jgi:hypothetical protein